MWKSQSKEFRQLRRARSLLLTRQKKYCSRIINELDGIVGCFKSAK
jgi:hypothetical protein